LWSCFQDVFNIFGLWFLFLLDVDIVVFKAELTFPRIVFHLREAIEHCSAVLAEYWVASRKFGVVLKCSKLNLEDVCVKFSLVFLVLSLLSFDLLSKVLCLILVIGHVKVTLKLK